MPQDQPSGSVSTPEGNLARHSTSRQPLLRQVDPPSSRAVRLTKRLILDVRETARRQRLQRSGPDTAGYD